MLDKDKDGSLTFPEFSLLAKGNLKEIKEHVAEVPRNANPQLQPILKSKLPKNMSVVGDLIMGKEPDYSKYLLYTERKNQVKLSPVDRNDCRRNNVAKLQATIKMKSMNHNRTTSKLRSLSTNKARQPYKKFM